MSLNRRFGSVGIMFVALAILGADATAQDYGSAVVATDDQVMVSRGPNDSGPGTIDVYARSANGGWAIADRLTAPNGGSDSDNFGRSIAVHGDIMIVGATGADDTVGAAYAMERAADGSWRHVQALMPEGLEAGTYLGRAVATNGRHALVATLAHNNNAGAVFVFERSDDGSWSIKQTLTNEENRPNRYFGYGLGMDGHHVFSIALYEERGALYTFRFDVEEDQYVQNGRIVANGEDLDRLDTETILIDGTEAYVGLPASQSVLRLAYSPDADTWRPFSTLLPFDGQSAGFGTAVAKVGDEIWVGAPGMDGGDGGVYRFASNGSAINGSTRMTIREVIPSSGAGETVAGNEMSAFVAAPTIGRGIVYALERAGDDWLKAGILGSLAGLASITGGEVRCEDGNASGYDCDGIDLLSYLPVHDVGGGPKAGSNGDVVQINDIWGWTDEETGNEYVVLGRIDGTSFIDITDPYNPRYLGNLPATKGSRAAVWRDVKVYQNHAFVVADGAGRHGMQVFDLTQLRDVVGAPIEFQETAHYEGIASAHNIVINEETGFAYSVGNSMGGQTCGGGYHIINVQKPTDPQFAGCWGHEGTGRAGTGYSHDAQCVVYRGPDSDYAGREICFGGNETAVSIADLSDKEYPVGISIAEYPNTAYAHQGWLSEDQQYFFVNDEIDEINGIERTRTLVFDVTDLDEPVLLREHMGETEASDHNMYVQGSFLYQSNYAAGLRILDVSDPANLVEVGHFDTTPTGSNAAGYSGTWSNYPYFRSGTIAVSSVAEGLFLLRKRKIDI